MTSQYRDLHSRVRNTVSRRQFIESSASVGALLWLAPLARSGAASFSAVPADSALSIARALRNRETSVVDVVRRCLETIEAVNPKLTALVTLCRERALAEARAADLAFASRKTVGPLHGVPFTVSDAFDTAGVASAGGISGRGKFVPARDATAVARLRSAGAILLGKSATSELALGESSAAGAIVAANASYFDIGADRVGPVRKPASSSGVAGLKPTLGRLSRTGHIMGYGGPFDAFVEAGPIARRVEDLALLLPILCGPDSADATLVPVPLGDASKIDLRTLRIARANGGDASAAAASARFESLGTRIRRDSPPKTSEFAELRTRYLDSDGGEYLRRRLKRLGSHMQIPSGAIIPSPDFTGLCESLDAIKREQLEWMEQYDLLVISCDTDAPCGWPTGIVRAGPSSKEIPSMVQLVAQPWREDILLAAMLHLEQASA